MLIAVHHTDRLIWIVAPGRPWLDPTLEGQGQGPVNVGWPWPGPARGQCRFLSCLLYVSDGLSSLHLVCVYLTGPILHRETA
jgi:hypothetical protein